MPHKYTHKLIWSGQFLTQALLVGDSGQEFMESWHLKITIIIWSYRTISYFQKKSREVTRELKDFNIELDIRSLD